MHRLPFVLGVVFLGASGCVAPDSPAADLAGDFRAAFPASRASSAHLADVTLPARADGPTAVVDRASGVRVDVRLEGATAAKAERDGDLVLFRGGHASGASLVHRVTRDGDEDFLSFEARPREESVTYSVDLGGRVASLRFVAGTLEALDDRGAPRLRMRAPFLIDATGARRAADLRVEGCAVDTSPIAPWGRAHVAPGAARCTIVIDWRRANVAYPAWLDPSWTTTGDLIEARMSHVGGLLADGHAIVAGGQGELGLLASAELFDEATETWSSTAPMSARRDYATGTTLDDGRFLVAGGSDEMGTPLATAEVFDSSTGAWTPTGAMNSAHVQHTATLTGGEVLVAGGYLLGGEPIPDAEIFDQTTNAWTSVDPMGEPRYQHAAAVLGDGRVVVTGGQVDLTGSPSGAVEIFDPSTSTWTEDVSLGYPRSEHAMLSLPDGTVMVVGGDTSDSLASAEIFDPVADAWTITEPLQFGHRFPFATVLPDGSPMVVAGYINTSTEIYTGGVWTTGPDLAVAREQLAGALLADGRVLVAGGESEGDPPMTASSELFSLDLDGGASCVLSGECVSGFCADGVCCDAACDDGCSVCAKANGATTDGTCTAIEGKACDDGDACTMNDTCQAGVCVGGAPMTCTASDACHETIGCSAGQCFESAVPDGAPCGGGTCFAGTCIGDPDAGPLTGSATSGSGNGGASATSGDGATSGSNGGSPGRGAIPEGDATATDSGCAMRTDRPSRDASALTLMLLLLAARRRSRRAR